MSSLSISSPPEAYISATDETFANRLSSFDIDNAPFTDLYLQCNDGIIKGHSLLFSAHSPIIYKLLTETMHTYRLNNTSSSPATTTTTTESAPATTNTEGENTSNLSSMNILSTPTKATTSSSSSHILSPTSSSSSATISTINGITTYTIDVRPATCTQLRYIRTFVYTGKVKLPAHDAGLLITAATRLQITHLKSAIETEVVARFIDADTACAYLLIGRTPNATSPAVEGAAREYIRRNTAACFASESFFDLDIDTLITLLKDDELSIREDDLFRYCLSWADVRSATEENKPSRILPNIVASNNNEISTTTSAMVLAPANKNDIFNPTSPSSPSPYQLWNKYDPQLSRKLIRENLLKLILPYIRFPVMGAQAFARTVVPTDALPTEDVSALLLYFMAPDVPNAAIRFVTKPRKGSGSVYTWTTASAITNSTIVSFYGTKEDNKLYEDAEETKYKNKLVTLSGDHRTANFQCPIIDNDNNTTLANRETMLLTEQSFAGGVATIYISTWGLDNVTVGLLKSDNDIDDGDCALMMVEHALADSLRFEGIKLYINKDNTRNTIETITRTSFYAPHQPRVNALNLLDNGINPTDTINNNNINENICLKDGSCIIIFIDWDVHRVTFSIQHKDNSKPIEIGTLNNIPIKPFRVCLGAVSRSSGGDIDGIVTINNKLPQYLKG